jgi:helix-turn-helix protein
MVAGIWTPRDVMALFPEYIFNRFSGYDEESLAREAGLSVDAITFDSLASLPYAPQIADDGLLSVARYRWRRPYLTRDPWTPIWEELIRPGFANRNGEKWFLTHSGAALCDELHRKSRRYLESLDVGGLDLMSLSGELSALADQIPSDAERTICAHRGLPLQDEIHSEIVRVDRCISELWNFRDDSHIAAWQAAGYTGPRIDVLSQVWEGKATVDQVVSALDFRQTRADVEHEIDALVEARELDRKGGSLVLTELGSDRRDSIERDTDARYFRTWPKGGDLARLGHDLTALVRGLPAGRP